MKKIILGFVAGLVLTGLFGYTLGGQLMFREVPSPFGVEETAARIQHNIRNMADRGWKLSGLRDPSRAVAAAFGRR